MRYCSYQWWLDCHGYLPEWESKGQSLDPVKSRRVRFNSLRFVTELKRKAGIFKGSPPKFAVNRTSAEWHTMCQHRTKRPFPWARDWQEQKREQEQALEFINSHSTSTAVFPQNKNPTESHQSDGDGGLLRQRRGREDRKPLKPNGCHGPHTEKHSLHLQEGLNLNGFNTSKNKATMSEGVSTRQLPREEGLVLVFGHRSTRCFVCERRWMGGGRGQQLGLGRLEAFHTHTPIHSE